jgi:mono/diheme cytochrome c family protein
LLIGVIIAVVAAMYPGFAAIAAMKSTTELSLQAFLQTPHDHMPDWRLSRQQIDDVVAYIMSLRPTSS